MPLYVTVYVVACVLFAVALNTVEECNDLMLKYYTTRFAERGHHFSDREPLGPL
jgi:hypothetical protein